MPVHAGGASRVAAGLDGSSLRKVKVLDPELVPSEELKAQAVEQLRTLHSRFQRRGGLAEDNAHMHIDFSPLGEVEGYAINNVGDPFRAATNEHGKNTHDFELGVIEWFSQLWDIALEDAWGFIANGGTEANIQGVLLGRESLPPGALLYYSAASHYSLRKAAMMLQVPTVEVGTLPSGEIDYGELQRKLEANRDRAAILALNIGTSGRGAIDDPAQVAAALEAAGFGQDRYHIHCDGALMGIMLPFIEGAPQLSFRRLPIGSISVSGHKFLGCPTPCGIILARRSVADAASRAVEHLNCKDVIVTCSRSGQVPLYLWYTLSLRGFGGVRRQVQHTLHLAQRLKELLTDNGIPASLDPWSTTVVFQRPQDDAFVSEWALPGSKDTCFMVAMPTLTEEAIEVFVDALVVNRKETERAQQLAGPAQGGSAALGSHTSSWRRQHGQDVASPQLVAAVQSFHRSMRVFNSVEQ